MRKNYGSLLRSARIMPGLLFRWLPPRAHWLRATVGTITRGLSGLVSVSNAKVLGLAVVLTIVLPKQRPLVFLEIYVPVALMLSNLQIPFLTTCLAAVIPLIFLKRTDVYQPHPDNLLLG